MAERGSTLLRDPARVVSASRARFVALGDSFTAGTGCPQGSSWADLVAASLPGPGRYLNLATDGATSSAVLAQLERVEDLRPELVTVVCGANDVLRSARPDLEGFADRFEAILATLAGLEPAPFVITANYPTGWTFAGLGPRTSARVASGIAFVNDVIRRLASMHSIPCLEVSGHPGLRDRENFAADGLHPSPRGHRRAARAFAAEIEALGMQIDRSEEEDG